MAHVVGHGRADWGVGAVGTLLGTAAAAGVSRVPRLTCGAAGFACRRRGPSLPCEATKSGGGGSAPVFRVALSSLRSRRGRPPQECGGCGVYSCVRVAAPGLFRNAATDAVGR